MKQHTALRDCNYDLGSLFKDHKTLQLVENGDKIQTDTEISSALCIISLKLYSHMKEMKNMK